MNAIDFEEIFERIPLLKHLSPDDFEIKALSGLTNLNFRLLNRDSDYVLRVPRSKTSCYIDRKVESFNVDQAIQAGLAPSMLWRDDSGLSLTRCITRSRMLTPDDFLDSAVLSLLVERLGVLHSSGMEFKSRIDLVELLGRYYSLMSAERSSELAACFEKALVIHKQINDKDQRIVPSHNDLVLENLLIDHQRKLWLIDWEYSAMASPYWDLATLCNAARLGPGQCRGFLDLYNNAVMDVDFEYLRGYQFMLQVLTIGWMAVFSAEPLDIEIDWLNRLDV